MDLVPRIARTIECNALLPLHARVLVACSGGGDSVALLHALQRLGHVLAVAHLDHAARESSADDATFVSQLAETLGLPCILERHPVAEEAKAMGLSFETHARNVRYEFLARAATAQNCSVIATGHSASDQAETMLMRILRGTGPAGLSGIPMKGQHHHLPVVRPLLETSREELRAWLKGEGLSWREDPTNEADLAQRNRVRNHLLTLLKAQYNPRIEEALCHLAETMHAEEQWRHGDACAAREKVVDQQGRVSRAAFAALPVALQRRVLLGWLQGLGVETDFYEVEDMLRFVTAAPTGSRHSLHGGALLYAGALCVEMETPEEALAPVELLRIPGEASLRDWHFIARVDEPPHVAEMACGPQRQWFDARTMGDAVELRTRRDGDRMHPLGAGGSRKLSDIMVDKKIPAPHRARLPLLVRGGEVLWFPGGPVSQFAAITPDTVTAVEVEVTQC